jgi:hypothetical protein
LFLSSRIDGNNLLQKNYTENPPPAQWIEGTESEEKRREWAEKSAVTFRNCLSKLFETKEKCKVEQLHRHGKNWVMSTKNEWFFLHRCKTCVENPVQNV